ncbi:hypothetical protein CBM2633_U10095 [Cupriavidus taiwanensis]|nr:hypothetical protein CBM2633_U10095 [Cupriavidus taiwanensis]
MLLRKEIEKKGTTAVPSQRVHLVGGKDLPALANSLQQAETDHQGHHLSSSVYIEGISGLLSQPQDVHWSLGARCAAQRGHRPSGPQIPQFDTISFVSKL